MAIIIGLDPGSLNFGYGIIESFGSELRHLGHGVIKNKSDRSLPERILKISTELNQVFKTYQPEHAAIEKIFLAKNADSAFKLGHVRGVAILESIRNKVSITEYAAREVKRGISGFGSAEKSQVLFMVRHLLDIPSLDQYDAADALAIAIYHSQCRDIRLQLDDSPTHEIERE